MSYYDQQKPPVDVPPPQEYPQQGYPQQAYPLLREEKKSLTSLTQPRQTQPPQSSGNAGFTEGCLAALCCCCL